MSTARTTNGLQWVVAVSIAAVLVLTWPGMLFFSFLIAVIHAGLELIFGLNLSAVSILLALIALVVAARVVAGLFVKN